MSNYVFRSEQSATQRSNAKCRVIIAGNRKHIAPRRHSAHFHAELRARPSDQVRENALPVFDFAEHRIREWDIAIRSDRGKLDKAFRLTDGEVAKQQSID